MCGEVPGRLPVGVAVAAQVDGDDAPVGETLCEAAIALPVGIDAVQANDARAVRVAPLVRVEPQSSLSSASSPVPEGR
jgi:hypothetical protein